MILGLGNDLTDVRRIEASIHRYGDRFIRRVFLDGEIARAQASRLPIQTYAKRFAAKEAAAKAVGVGLWRQGVTFRDFEIANDPGGKPSLHLHGQARKLVQAQLPKRHYPVFHVSMSDDGPWAQAFVIIEARTLNVQ
ncbi:holo-ACP synthase [Woodsholea maritima]|uniref:holo-ACP synthase n=1 Tax=Woodsholea maritima TaxID=240237 RepID=UPI00035DBD0C|nr:holo-ACP synthase [Woodsholea maritima]